jgi:hypothetical protein
MTKRLQIRIAFEISSSMKLPDVPMFWPVWLRNLRQSQPNPPNHSWSKRKYLSSQSECSHYVTVYNEHYSSNGKKSWENRLYWSPSYFKPERQDRRNCC